MTKYLNITAFHNKGLLKIDEGREISDRQLLVKGSMMGRSKVSVGGSGTQVSRKTPTGGSVAFLERIPSRFIEHQAVSKAVWRGQSVYSSAVSVPEVSSREEFLIRCMDVAGALLLLGLSLPLFAVIVVLVRLSSPGPVIYRQRRVTRGGKLFLLYKFRTMVGNAERGTGPVLARPDDPRVTPIGRFLRRTRLDELPQLLNILRGDMSLVGPRPERPYFVRRHKELQGARLSVKPGLTGLAQINGCYDLKPRHKVRYDRLYIRKRSVWLNVYILLKTIPVVLWRRNGW